jgi:hypothetical protein
MGLSSHTLVGGGEGEAFFAFLRYSLIIPLVEGGRDYV